MNDQIALLPVVGFGVHMKSQWVRSSRGCMYGTGTHTEVVEVPPLIVTSKSIRMTKGNQMLLTCLTPQNDGLMPLGSGTTTSVKDLRNFVVEITVQISEAFIAARDNIQLSVNTKGRAAGTNWGKRIMGSSWHSAHLWHGATPIPMVPWWGLGGSKMPWTEIKSGCRMSLAVVNSRKCEQCKKSLYGTEALNI